MPVARYPLFLQKVLRYSEGEFIWSDDGFPFPTQKEYALSAWLGVPGWYCVRTGEGCLYGRLSIILGNDDASDDFGEIEITYGANSDGRCVLVQTRCTPLANSSLVFSRIRLRREDATGLIFLDLFSGNYGQGIYPFPYTRIIDTGFDSQVLHVPTLASEGAGMTILGSLVFGDGFRVCGNSSRVGNETYPIMYEYPIPVPSYTLVEGTAGWDSSLPNNTQQIRVYAYKTVAGQRYYTERYAQSEAFDVDEFDCSEIDWGWTAVSGADGYRVYRRDVQNEFDFVTNWRYQDVVNNSLVDTGVNWLSGQDPTGHVCSEIAGFAIVNGEICVGKVSAAGKSVNVSGSIGTQQLYVRDLPFLRFGRCTPELLLSNDELVTVADSVVETTIIAATPLGSKQLPSSVAYNHILRVRGSGIISTRNAEDTFKLKFLFNPPTLFPTTIIDTGSHTLPPNLVDAMIRFEFDIRIASLGEESFGAIPSGSVTIMAMAATAATIWPIASAEISGDWVSANTLLDIVAQWGYASVSNTFTCQQLTVELLPVQ